MIITFSGIDGSGKSTCAEMAKSIMESMQSDVIIADAMKSGRYIEELKTIAYKERQKLRDCFSPDMLNIAWTSDLIHNYEKVQNEANNVDNIIFHRSELCCRVYSRLFSPDSSIVDSILDHYNIHYDLSVFLSIDPEIAYQRIMKRSNISELTSKEDLDMLINANRIYQIYLQKTKFKNIHIIDATKPFESIYDELKKLINDYKKY